MARKRLCFKASKETREVMEAIVLELAKQGDILADYLMPQCWYRGGKCHETKGCGLYDSNDCWGSYKDRIIYFKESEKRLTSYWRENEPRNTI